jgi:hypothetical protein
MSDREEKHKEIARSFIRKFIGVVVIPLIVYYWFTRPSENRSREIENKAVKDWDFISPSQHDKHRNGANDFIIGR